MKRRWCILCGLLPTLVSACVTRTPAAPDRFHTTVTVADVDWPTRPHEPTPLRVVRGKEYGELVDFGRRGEGLLYQLRFDETQTTAAGGYEIGIGTAEDDVWFGISGTAGDIRVRDVPETRRWAAWPFIFTTEGMNVIQLSNQHGETFEVRLGSRQPDLTVLTFALPPEGTTYRGTTLMLASLDGMTAGERALLAELRARGWVVIWTAPSLAQLRTQFFLPPEEDADVLVDEFASRINHNVSERAYALEAALDVLYERIPELATLPLTALGCSAGAITLPTVAARLEQPLDAAVLVGGGCDMFEIVTRSDLFRGRIRIYVDMRQINQAELDALRDPILERARLDPYHTAVCLHDTPVLMLHGSFDRIVPADRGDLLYERLGRPERWTFPVGHLGLFFLLPSQTDAIIDWMETQADDADSSTK